MNAKTVNGPRWAVAISAFLATLYPLADGDIWWHLAAAREMWESGGFLRADPFTFTALGQNWMNVHWLYQLLCGFFYYLGSAISSEAGGAWSVVILHSALWGAAAYVWWELAGNLVRPKAGAVLVAVALFWLLRWNLLARPLAPTLLILGLQGHWIVRWNTQGHRRDVAGLLISQVVLANMQGLFLLGPVLAWASLQRRRLPILLALIAVSALHPHGLNILWYPFRLVSRILPGNLFSLGIAENIPPHHLLATGAPDAWTLVVLTGALLLGLGGYFYQSGLRRWWVWSAWPEGLRRALVLLPLAWMARRNLPLFAFAMLPIVASWRTVLPIPLQTAYIVVALQAGAVGLWWGHYKVPIALHRFPQHFTEVLERHTAPHAKPLQLFHAVEHGGYLVWKLPDRVQTYVDGRLILRDSVFFAEYLRVLEQPANFAQLHARMAFDAVVLPRHYPQVYRALAQHMEGDPDWREFYRDESIIALYPLQSAGGKHPAIPQIPAANTPARARDSSVGLPRNSP